MRSARIITGNMKSTPNSIVLQEVGLEVITDRQETAGYLLHDRWTQLDDEDVRRETALREVPQITTKRTRRRIMCRERQKNKEVLPV